MSLRSVADITARFGDVARAFASVDAAPDDTTDLPAGDGMATDGMADGMPAAC